MFEKIKQFLNSPKVARGLGLMFGLSGILVPPQYQGYVVSVGIVLGGLGYVLPDKVQKKVDALVESHGAMIDEVAKVGVDVSRVDELAPATKEEIRRGVPPTP